MSLFHLIAICFELLCVGTKVGRVGWSGWLCCVCCQVSGDLGGGGGLCEAERSVDE